MRGGLGGNTNVGTRALSRGSATPRTPIGRLEQGRQPEETRKWANEIVNRLMPEHLLKWVK
jgi:hypothetical protein